MGVSPSVDQLGPDVVKASRFEPGPEGENALAPNTTPSLATALEPGVDDHCVRRLDSTAAYGGTRIAGLPITHPLAVTADNADCDGDPAVSCVLSPEITQRIDHRAPAMGIICQDGLVCVEPCRAPGALGPRSGIGSGLERGVGRPDIDPPDIRVKLSRQVPLSLAPSTMTTLFSSRPNATASRRSISA